jgi:ligand-binding sensor domain-containing protein
VSTLTGISVYSNGKWLYHNYNNNIANNSGQDILVAQDSSVWIGTNSGLMRWKNDSFRIFTTADGLTDNVIRAIYQDRSGALWIGTERGGVCCFNNDGFSSFRASDGLTSDFVDAVLKDREGNFWIGTYTEGVNQFIKSKFVNYSVKNGLPQGTIRTVIQTSDSINWIGTEGNGLVRFDGKKFTTLNTKRGLPNDFIRSLFEDSHRNLWIGTRDGLAQYRNGKIRVYSERDGLKDTFIRAIAEDWEGYLWVGTVNGGVHRFVNGKFVNYRSKGIPMNNIRSVFVDHNNTVWIACNEAVVKWHDGKISMLSSKDGLPVEPVYTIYEDGSNTMWLGTNGGGLVRIKGDVITRYTYSQGLSDDVVHDILEDDLHNLWMSCNGGIFRVSKQQLNDFAEGRAQRIHCTFYDAADGMISNEISGNSQPAGWKTFDGRLWFPALRGVVVVDPLNLHENTNPPPMVIERAILNSVDQQMPQNGIVIPPGPGRVEFHFAALTFISPNKVQYRFKLEGFDDDWSSAGDRTRAVYTNLPPNRYVFRVAGCNNDGVWSEMGASLAFELKPYYYQTVWFYGLVVLIFVSMIFGAYRWYLWRFLKRESELKKRVEEALAEIKILSGLIPICSNCKKIRDDKGFWDQLEHYIDVHSEATFTHSICPDCAEKLYPELFKTDKKT